MSDLKEKLKERWRKLKIIRPAFWWLYKRRPRKTVMRMRVRYWQNKVFPDLYRDAAQQPVNENKAVFIELRYPEMTTNIRFLHDRMKYELHYDVESFCLDSSHKKRFETYRDLKPVVTSIATAKYVFLTDGSVALGKLPMRPETVMVQTWHACGAFKRFGRSTAALKFGMDAKDQEKNPAYGNINFIAVSSPEVIWAYAEAMNRPKEYVHPVGVSRTDVFFSEERKKQAYDTLYEHIPAARGKKVILYAPTYRGHIANCTTPDLLRIDQFHETLGDEYVLVIKHHPLVKELPPVPEDLNGTFAFDVTRTMDIDDLLITADICITDYSSLIFEYSLFERPMIFFAYDLEDYYDWRGFYYPFEELTPGPVCRTNEEMIDYIRHIDERFDREQVSAFRERFMSACDGHATERTLEAVIEEGKKFNREA